MGQTHSAERESCILRWSSCTYVTYATAITGSSRSVCPFRLKFGLVFKGETTDLPITVMRRLLEKIKREKSPKPPQQPTLQGKPVGVAAGPPDFRKELDDNPAGGRNHSSQVPEVDSPDPAMPQDEGGKIGPRILVQDGVDANQQLPASGAQTSDVAIGGTGRGSLLTGKYF